MIVHQKPVTIDTLMFLNTPNPYSIIFDFR